MRYSPVFPSKANLEREFHVILRHVGGNYKSRIVYCPTETEAIKKTFKWAKERYADWIDAWEVSEVHDRLMEREREFERYFEETANGAVEGKFQ